MCCVSPNVHMWSPWTILFASEAYLEALFLELKAFSYPWHSATQFTRQETHKSRETTAPAVYDQLLLFYWLCEINTSQFRTALLMSRIGLGTMCNRDQLSFGSRCINHCGQVHGQRDKATKLRRPIIDP